MSTRWQSVLFAALIGGVGCSKATSTSSTSGTSPGGSSSGGRGPDEPAAPAVSHATAPSTSGPAVSAPPAAEAQLLAPATEAAAKALLDAWLQAQNRGDFASYEQLYAARFTGVKRSGERTRKLGRDGWMLDRAKMFRRPMQVDAANVTIHASANLARVHFDQTWSSGTYRDAGPKELLLVIDRGTVRIGREEMLSSRIDKDRPTRAALDLRLVDAGVVVLRQFGVDDFATGPIRGVDAGSGVREVRRDVVLERLPADARSLLGARLQAVAADGAVCATQIQSLEVRGQVLPHFSFGRSESGELVERPPEQELQELWQLTDRGGRDLVGVLQPPCTGSLWVLEAGDPVPQSHTPSAVDGALLAAAMKLYERLPRYAELQASFLEYHPRSREPWHGGVQAHQFQPKQGRTTLLLSGFRDEGCSDFSGALSAVFEVGAGSPPKLTLLGTLDREAAEPVTAFDLDGDGHLEILNGSDKFRFSIHYDGKGLDSKELLDVLNLDCPC